MVTTSSHTFQKRLFSIAPYKDSWHEIEAFEGDHLVGRIVAFEAPARSRDCWIHDLWVEPSKRRSGLGSELLRQTIEAAKSHHYLRMLGEFRPYDGASSGRLEAFFREHGFTIDRSWGDTGKPVAVLLLT